MHVSIFSESTFVVWPQPRGVTHVRAAPTCAAHQHPMACLAAAARGATFHPASQRRPGARRVRSATGARRVCRSSGGGGGIETAKETVIDTGGDDHTTKIQTLRERGLQIPSYAEADLEAALVALKTAEDIADGLADDDTMRWFLKDRALDVEAAAEKVRKYNTWRVENQYDNISFESVREEFDTGKAVLLEERDLLGRQVVSVTLTKHVIAERDLEDTKRLTVYLLDKGLERIRAGAANGCPETVLAVFDLRGFSAANADIDFLKFFIECIVTYFPKRVSEVLFIEAPFVFRPVWSVVKPWLGKYSSLARFVTVEEANAYFAEDASVFR